MVEQIHLLLAVGWHRKHFRHFLMTFFTSLRLLRIQNRSLIALKSCSDPQCFSLSCSFFRSIVMSGCDDGKRIGCFLSSDISACLSLPPTLMIPSGSMNGFNSTMWLFLLSCRWFFRATSSSSKTSACTSLASTFSAYFSSSTDNGCIVFGCCWFSCLFFFLTATKCLTQRQYATIRRSFEKFEVRSKISCLWAVIVNTTLEVLISVRLLSKSVG